MSKKDKQNHVCIQKGPIKSHEESYRTMSHREKQFERLAELDMIHKGQTMETVKPK